MAKTDAQLLEATREAIDSLTTGRLASYSLNGQQFTKLDLPTLWDQVGILEKRVARASRGRFSVAVKQPINKGASDRQRAEF